MIRGLVIGGAVLVGIGVVVLALLLPAGHTPVAPIGAPIEMPGSTAAPPSRLWSIVAGLMLAGGAGMIGIGMNRWRRVRVDGR
jgi:hypothetical protein